MPKVWRFAPFDEPRVRFLAGQAGISPLLAAVLIARGIQEAAEAREFLDPKLTGLHDPDQTPEIAAAADRIVAAVRAGRRITIYGDYDVDGVTSMGLLWHCLQLAGGKVDYYVPHRLEEGYGLNSEALRSLHERDPRTLVVTVDCGITSVAEAAVARELGLELIITDHHTPGPEMPDVDCVVHPRLPGKEWPFEELCGVGVAFKIAWAVCQRLGDGRRASPPMKEFLMSAMGLAAIGTVADVVPLRGENRIMVRFGLHSLVQRAAPGLKALLQLAGLHEKPLLQAEDIAFGIAPRINAAGRLGQARLAVELLTTQDAERAVTLAQYLEEQNKVRQTVERKILKHAKEMVAENPQWLEQPALVLAHHEWHAGVIGIVASRVAETFSKPAILISLNHQDQTGQGSARSFAGFNLHGGLLACESHLLTFGGHQAAAGLRIDASKIESFREAFCEFVGQNHSVKPRDLEIDIDAEVRLSDLTLRAVHEIDRLGPFGCGNRRPVFASSQVELVSPPRKMGGGERHLSLQVRQYGQTFRAVAFGRAEWADEMAAVTGPLAVCYAPHINSYRGRESVELHLLDWQPEEVPASRESSAVQSAGS